MHDEEEARDVLVRSRVLFHEPATSNPEAFADT